MGLSDEIRENAKKVHTTEMKMSIGEIISMYKDKEIIIQPEFQRLFRWNIEQKSRFVESILIGIPIPSIFVQQLENGTWEVIDGLQRISTILEFAGVLLDGGQNLCGRLELEGTKFLPSLKHMTYESFKDNPRQPASDICFDNETRLIFKRTPLIIQVVKRESDESTKYELFDRLNSSGSTLTAQEIRNAIFLLEKPEAIRFIKELSSNPDFVNIVALSEDEIKNAFNEELIIRFFAYVTIPDKINNISSMKDFLDAYLRDYFDIDRKPELRNVFDKFFKFLNQNLTYKIFRRENKRGILGNFKISKFEAIIIGLYPYLDKLDNEADHIKSKIRNIEDEDWFIESSKQGSQAKNRINSFRKNATEYFKF